MISIPYCADCILRPLLSLHHRKGLPKLDRSCAQLVDILCYIWRKALGCAVVESILDATYLKRYPVEKTP